ncbi:hypothetical protein [uncultured Nonlabens sp.]|uniref:hypothetical protein n=1 Tax=uncultured Nonlabens sp. TaxID=859306 RepID=UPI002611AC40|nr:hypothetical protein [uncultured Nonlabens sp.]
MKHLNNILFIALATLIQSCSSSDDEPSSVVEPTINRKSIESIIASSGNDDLYILREDDRIVKYYSQNTTIYHHLKYNSDLKVEGMNTDGTGNASLPFTGFNYDYLTGVTTPLEAQFNYTGAFLTSITGNYQSAGIIFTYNADDTINSVELGSFLFTFIYDGTSDNPVAYTRRNLFNASDVVRWELTFDDKVNPLYKDWINDSFLFSFFDIGSFPRENFCFFKNNVVRRENIASNEAVIITYEYDNDDHPTSYRIVRPGLETRSGSINY